MNKKELTKKLKKLRRKMDKHFSAETSINPETWASGNPSAGHCAIVAIVVHKLYGGSLLSTYVFGESHWYNMLKVDYATHLDVDLTGDQFEHIKESVRVAKALTLNHDSVRIRSIDEVNDETMERALIFAKKLGVNIS